ncbi:MAG: D-alanyl-D-alanine carboxypeptidase [Bacilli bacterium]|nr:D-alanyl-D-alanine carboxypeptidase [Bacilli bacterium]
MKRIVIILIFLSLISVFPVYVFANDNNNLIPGAVSGLLMDADSGKIIFEKDKNKRVAVASMTKMVAQIIVMEKIDEKKIKWDDIVTVSKNAADMGGSQIYIAEGEKITVEDLMKGISMASGNDATVAMAEYISGSENKFVELMNKKVKELGLKNTVFKNCTGLDEDGHYSSAYDMAIIARELIIKHPDIFRFSSVYEDYLREDTDNKFWLVNTNKLVRFYEGADGLKTGHTDNAGYCLAATAKRNNLRLIAIVLGEGNATTRNNETMELLDYGYKNLKTVKLKSSGDIVKKIKFDKADTKIVDIVLKNDLYVTENITDNKEYKYKIDIDDLKLPIKIGDIVGKIEVYSGNRKIKEGNLTVSKDINPLSFMELIFKEIVDLAIGEF